MKRIAFKMQLKDGQKEAYVRRHNEIWNELKRLLQESGVHEYSIFLDDETNILFGFQKVNGDKGSQDLGQLDIVKKWWDFMSDIIEVNEDSSPVTVALNEVFYME